HALQEDEVRGLHGGRGHDRRAARQVLLGDEGARGREGGGGRADEPAPGRTDRGRGRGRGVGDAAVAGGQDEGLAPARGRRLRLERAARGYVHRAHERALEAAVALDGRGEIDDGAGPAR